MVANDGKRQRTTVGPPPDHRSTVVDRQSIARPGWVVGWSGSGLRPGLDRVGSGSATCHATWYHLSADVAWRGYYPPAFRTHDLPFDILRNHMRPPAL
ncbi:hypothetical protein Tco_1497886, partial [Tanacetum coccineum]